MARFGRVGMPLAAGVVEIGKRKTASGELAPNREMQYFRCKMQQNDNLDHRFNVVALQIDAPPRVTFIYGFNCTFSVTKYVFKGMCIFGRGRMPLAAGVVEIEKTQGTSGDLAPELKNVKFQKYSSNAALRSVTIFGDFESTI